MKPSCLLFFVYINVATTAPSSLVNVEIIGGKNASINDYPWLVSLYKNEFGFQCGGFLISPSWIVTAANCIDIPNLDYARAGSNSTSSDGVVAQLSEKIMHPNFNWVNMDNNIAVLRLEIPVTGDNIEPIDLPDPENVVPEGDILQTAGWGLINDTDYYIYPDTLQEVDIPALGIEKCREIYGNFRITDNMLYIGYLDGEGKGPCLGDFGSPVIWKGLPVGIVSWTRECASSVYPTVIIKVADYRDWIRNVTGL